ncbi:cupin domain-containing protein [Gloeocapsopsis crepidinum LEGE 06123]|uniref:Cupin domain-containing protein n=1 Tax=Gloeocapsopsis crepidinum LEGE 06123 TaxID=588587 RepID=A0ABR9USG3_9CHRO|nr:cupin domain-containing protein [Gloeocapsopsis crepidinum]MBE9190963.1 cupin domain-containing protein [Gloeocapsopsis crepidinum LEGE 06123]
MKTIIAFVLFTVLMLVMPLNAWAAIARSAAPEAISIPSTSNQPIQLIHPGKGETFQVGGDFITFKTLSEDTPGELSVIEITAAPQSGPPLHKHPPEVFYIVDGEFEFYGASPEDTVKATAGDFIHIPSGAPHAYKNVGTTPGKYLLFTSIAGNPGQLWFQKFEYEMSNSLGNRVTDETSASTIPKFSNNKSMAAIARKYGIEFLE